MIAILGLERNEGLGMSLLMNGLRRSLWKRAFQSVVKVLHADV